MADTNDTCGTALEAGEETRTLTTMDAIGIAEGFIECDDDDTIIGAWQHLIDTGLAWELQGSFGRMARDLIASGVCVLPGMGVEEVL